MNDLALCVIEWLDELVEYALERQPSVALAHTRFAKHVETAEIHVNQNGVMAKYLTESAAVARKQAQDGRATILAKIQMGDTYSAKIAVRQFFRELEKATLLEQQAALMRRRNRKMLFLLGHLQAIERRLYYLSVFLAPLPAFVASEQDDHAMLLRSIWEFVSGEISTEPDTRTTNLVERFESLESKALKEYAHIDARHAARMRSSERHKFEKRIMAQLPLLRAELAEQTEKHFELLAKEKLHTDTGNRFESQLFSVRRQHCEKQTLRLEVYELILERTYESLQPSAMYKKT